MGQDDEKTQVADEKEKRMGKDDEKPGFLM